MEELARAIVDNTLNKFYKWYTQITLTDKELKSIIKASIGSTRVTKADIQTLKQLIMAELSNIEEVTVRNENNLVIDYNHK